MRELVIVVPDLYLPRELRGASSGAAAFAGLTGLERVARFGTRAKLPGGWRQWLLRNAGRTDLESVAPVCIAAAGLDASFASAPAVTREDHQGARWIARAVHLQAGLRRVHLEHRGLLRLTPQDQAELAGEFARMFGSSGCALAPLPAGELLLDTPAIIPVATHEPARCIGGELDELMPVGPAAAPLRRLLAEIEMWLHAQPLNEARSRRGEATVTALWPWGAVGRIVRPESRAQSETPLAFGDDAWLAGLCRVEGSACRRAPEQLEEVLAAGAARCVLVVEVGGQLRRDEDTVAEAARAIDERFISPALQALRRGALGGFSVIINDTCVQVRRASLYRFWRRGHSGLAAFA